MIKSSDILNKTTETLFQKVIAIKLIGTHKINAMVRRKMSWGQTVVFNCSRFGCERNPKPLLKRTLENIEHETSNE